MADKKRDAAHIVPLDNMYEDYFLDYASYVILERAVPAIEDGLKSVQRRILYAMRQMEDGRFHKVANIIGQTMQFHPHGDAAIGDALVNLGQKEFLIETQGNWGDVRTGDSAAAPRYIEARLTKFALETLFNPSTTEYQLSYDGRKKEPVHLPAKFPILLLIGVEGIAVGLSTRILPHNFQEICHAAIAYLQDKKFKLLPDFDTGGILDAGDYKKGTRGSRIKVRAQIEVVDRTTVSIKELPYGITTSSLIDSILKANDKGKIKIKQITDNTAKELEIQIELNKGVSPELTIDALYAFTNCEVSISPNACIIQDLQPKFLDVHEILKTSVDQTRSLLRRELEIAREETKEKWHFLSLEKIFIENRIYHQIEEAESWEEVVQIIDREMHKYISTPERNSKDKYQLHRELTEEDIVRLTEIRIKRITKYNSSKAEEKLKELEVELTEIEKNLNNLTNYTISWFQMLLDTYGKGRTRKTEIRDFEEIEATLVAASNVKLYVNRKEGMVGYGIKNAEFVREASDIDDIIAIRRDGMFQVSRIADKVFMGKNILHLNVWKKGDTRTTYNMIYMDGKTGRSMVKRFQVKSIIRDKEYRIVTKDKNSRVLYLSANPNGEAETVKVILSPNCRARNKVFTFDFSTIDIKGRGAKGNILTKYPVRKIELEEIGVSTIGAMTLYVDRNSGRVNKSERGELLGDFDTGNQIIAFYKKGTYRVFDFDLPLKIPPDGLIKVEKYDPDAVITAVYYDGHKKKSYVKRFQIETSTTEEAYSFISEHRSTNLYFLSTDDEVVVKYKTTKKGAKWETLNLTEFIDVKGWKALGNQLEPSKLRTVKEIDEEQESNEIDFEITNLSGGS